MLLRITESKRPIGGWKCTTGRILVFHSANLVLIPGTTYGSLNSTRSDSKAQSQESTLNMGREGKEKEKRGKERKRSRKGR